MSKPRNIDDILKGWPYEAQSVSVRMVRGDDGREVIQMRVDMGVLQLETAGRPDGERPHGADTYYDHLVQTQLFEGENFSLDEEQCIEIDREFVQFYHRRICWLALNEYGRAAKDADHTLAMMDFCRAHSDDEEWSLSHEQYRPFVMFHRIQASALEKLRLGQSQEPTPDVERKSAEAAIQEINDGLANLRSLFAEYEAEEDFDDDELVNRLIDLREKWREDYEIGRTLREQLDDAIAAEQYEAAARLRDQLSRREAR